MNSLISRQDAGPKDAHFFSGFLRSFIDSLKKMFRGNSENEDVARREHILLIVLWANLLAACILSIFVLYYDHIAKDTSSSMPLETFLLIPLSFILLIAATKKGHSRLASHLTVALYLLGTLMTSYIWGFDLPASMLLDVLVITLASALLGTQRGLYVTIIICLSMISLGALQIIGVLSYSSSWRTIMPTLDDPFQYAIFLFIGMTLSWLSNREIERSLHRARTSESALQIERDELEKTVLERTDELRIAHLRELSQSRTFVEFGKMASGILHDLINPLTALDMQIKQVAEKGRTELDKAIATSERMSKLLASARSSMHFKEKPEYFDASLIVIDAYVLHCHTASLNNVTILPIDSNAQECIFGPSHILRQALCTLLTNAIEAHAHKDGQSEDREKEKFVWTKIIKNDKSLVITIEDNASGIPPSIATKLFTPFNTTKGPQGTGIGLYLAKESLAHYFNGTIHYSPSQTGGSIFTISLPTQDKPRQ